MDEDDLERHGGTAFPTADYHTGMSLRDWFAGQAISGMCSNREYDDTPWSTISELAYKLAGEMIRERGLS